MRDNGTGDMRVGAPFGDVGISGFDREGSKVGILDFVSTKTVDPRRPYVDLADTLRLVGLLPEIPAYHRIQLQLGDFGDAREQHIQPDHVD